MPRRPGTVNSESVNADKVRVRFAPSPTGSLHVGNARTALFNYLFSKSREGSFILRIEDTDFDREVAGAEQTICDDLRWMGIEWDEGPDVGGEYGPYRQSDRLELYDKYVRQLLEMGLAYPCYCSEERLEEKRREAARNKQPPGYDGTCRGLSAGQRSEREKTGGKGAVRFTVPSASIGFTDLVRGKMRFDGRTIGDFIIRRSNGVPSYNFASAVDDATMKITHIIRGEDHLANTPRQILIANALGFSPPEYAHLSTVLGSDRTRLSKRNGSASIKEIRESGILKEGFVNYLSLLGWSSADKKEIFSLAEIIHRFSLERVSRSPSLFDGKKLSWVNGRHIKAMSSEELLERAVPFLEQAGIRVKEADRDRLTGQVNAVKENSDDLIQLADYLTLFYRKDVDWSEEALEIVSNERNRPLFDLLIEETGKVDTIDASIFRHITGVLMKRLDIKGKRLYMPIRAALTGKTDGPELDRIIPLLGKELLLKRLKAVLAPVHK